MTSRKCRRSPTDCPPHRSMKTACVRKSRYALGCCLGGGTTSHSLREKRSSRTSRMGRYFPSVSGAYSTASPAGKGPVPEFVWLRAAQFVPSLSSITQCAVNQKSPWTLYVVFGHQACPYGSAYRDRSSLRHSPRPSTWPGSIPRASDEAEVIVSRSTSSPMAGSIVSGTAGSTLPSVPIAPAPASGRKWTPLTVTSRPPRPWDSSKTTRASPTAPRSRGSAEHGQQMAASGGRTRLSMWMGSATRVRAPVRRTPRVALRKVDSMTSPTLADRLEWFRDRKFGLFMHWGPYSQWGCIESWPLVEEDTWARPDDLPAWVERGKDIERFKRDYFALNRTFDPTEFDPRPWAAAAKRAGMQYVVFTTKHHDGFSMFDTRQTDYRITHPDCPFSSDPRANVAREVFDAFREEGFGIGVYFSKSDWHCPYYWSPDRPARTRNPNYDTAAEPEKWERFAQFVHGQIEELMTGYGPVDILWLDGGQVRPPLQDIRMDEIAAMARTHQPGLIIADRT
ncbi:MAG: hypothetical protein FJX75_10030, partial [Armatimonadetes bacterium]|nr:hypothetical protein [Armatimonadota bacterium]